MSVRNDFNRLMEAALEQARKALEIDEVPIGAVLARGGEIIAAAHNRRLVDADPTAHAEMLVLRDAARKLGDWRLEGCTLAVTLEPCCMCAGAIVLARLPLLLYGADDPKGGAVRTLYRLCDDERLNHRVDIHAGILAEPCGRLLSDFFRKQRELGKK
jgi:tRNA(adenine34) deaminase